MCTFLVQVYLYKILVQDSLLCVINLHCITQYFLSALVILTVIR